MLLRYKVMFVILSLLLLGSIFVPAGGVAAAEPERFYPPSAGGEFFAPVYPIQNYEFSVPEQLSITVDSDQLLGGAQLMIDALGGPYLFIAGLGLGVAILGAILAAVTRVRM